MNRRSFIDSVIRAGACAAILPSAVANGSGMLGEPFPIESVIIRVPNAKPKLNLDEIFKMAYELKRHREKYPNQYQYLTCASYRPVPGIMEQLANYEKQHSA